MQYELRSEVVKSSQNNYRWLMLVGTMLVFLFLSSHAHATDLLANTMGDVKDTITGTGKKWIIAIDFAISLGAFAMTKKPFVFFSSLGVLLALSGIGALIS